MKKAIEFFLIAALSVYTVQVEARSFATFRGFCHLIFGQHDEARSSDFRVATFLVYPFKIGPESVSLIKNLDSTYTVSLKTGFAYGARLGFKKTLSYHDVSDAVSVALRDSGVSPVRARLSVWTRGEMRIALAGDVDFQTRTEFENILSVRVHELIDPASSRLSRVSSVALGVDANEAILSAQSGFVAREKVEKALGIPEIANGGLVDHDQSTWHASGPQLISSRFGEFALLVDDRIYYHELPVWQSAGLASFIQAHAHPMEPVETPGGAIIVYSSADQAPFWSGFIEHYSVFSSNERAQKFIKNHRFVFRGRDI